MKRILFSLMLLCAVSGVCLAQHGWHAIDAITLDQCPTEYGGMTAVPVIEDYVLKAVKVYQNGDLLQIITPEDEDDVIAGPVYDSPEYQLVHFPDADNDGHRDLFVGTGGSRTQNSLYLWNPETSRFERCRSAADLQNPVFCPREGAVYDGGSSSAWEFSFFRYVWKGRQLEETHTLEMVENLADYNRNADPQYRKTHSYVLTPKSGRALKTNRRSELPAKWQKIMKIILD